MGNKWSSWFGRTATSENVSHERVHTVQSTQEGTDTPSQANQTQERYSVPQNPSNIVEGKEVSLFGEFLVDLESNLTRDCARKLATGFNFKPPEIEKIEKVEESSNPGHVFVSLALEKGLINKSYISALINKLEFCDFRGVATDVRELFRKYRQAVNGSESMEYQEKRKTFIEEIKGTYENQYYAVQPIPYIREKRYRVDRVFVEGGIEYFVAKDGRREEGWKKLNSYRDMFKDAQVTSTRRIIEGDPGFGKSTVTLQIAHDWCNSTPGSFLHNFEILILLRLRQLRGVKKIQNAIKQFILPKESQLDESDVQQILQNSVSVLVVLDGFDEYPDQGDETSDITSIIKREMFQRFEVIITTRTACLPTDYAPQSQRIRLTGFDEKARDEYIRKAVVSDDDDAVTNTKHQLAGNPILADLCQVPLFFVIFAHMSHESKDLEDFDTVTEIFAHMIECFHHHMQNKMKEKNVQTVPTEEKDLTELHKVAFEGLIGNNQQLAWRKKELLKRLGQDIFDEYVGLGILVEEDVLDKGTTLDANVRSYGIKREKEVRFYHKLFCEWFAAHYLSELVAKPKVRVSTSPTNVQLFRRILGKKAVEDILRELDPFDLQYLFRFSCGLNIIAAGKIIKYLNKINADNFAVLCILEQVGEVSTILDSVKNLCRETVSIRYDDTLLLQRSTIQLLEIAASNDISIPSVYLYHCYNTVSLTGGSYIQLKCEIYIPILSTLEKLQIHERGRDITIEEITSILQYSSMCQKLEEIRFLFCVLPQQIQTEFLTDLRSRNVKVLWDPHSSSPFYELHMESGQWKRTEAFEGEMMTVEDYQREVEKVRRRDG